MPKKINKSKNIESQPEIKIQESQPVEERSEELIDWPQMSIEIAELLSDLRQNKITEKNKDNEQGKKEDDSSQEVSEKESPSFIAMRETINNMVNDFDKLVVILENIFKSEDAKEALEMAVVKDDELSILIGEKNLDKLIASNDSKSMIERWLNLLRDRINILRKVDSSFDPWHELKQALKNNEINPSIFESITKKAEERAVSLEIEEELLDTETPEDFDIYKGILDEEQQRRQAEWAEKRKQKDDIIEYLKAPKKRRTRRSTGQADEKSDSEDSRISDLFEVMAKEPGRYEEIKRTLNPYLQEKLEDLLNETKVKEPKRRELEDLKEMLSEDWNYLVGLLSEDTSSLPEDMVIKNESIMRGVLDMIDNIKKLEQEIKEPFVPEILEGEKRDSFSQELISNPLYGALLRREGSKFFLPLLERKSSFLILSLNKLSEAQLKEGKGVGYRKSIKVLQGLISLVRESSENGSAIDPEYELSKLVVAGKLASYESSDILKELLRTTKKSLGLQSIKKTDAKND